MTVLIFIYKANVGMIDVYLNDLFAICNDYTRLHIQSFAFWLKYILHVFISTGICIFHRNSDSDTCSFLFEFLLEFHQTRRADIFELSKRIDRFDGMNWRQLGFIFKSELI